jgi:hypothetical protein
MMTRQARPSAKIIGFDTHMILEAVPTPQTTERATSHQPDITPLYRSPAKQPGCFSPPQI